MTNVVFDNISHSKKEMKKVPGKGGLISKTHSQGRTILRQSIYSSKFSRYQNLNLKFHTQASEEGEEMRVFDRYVSFPKNLE